MKAIERESPRPNATRAASKRPSECAGDIIRDAVSTPPKDFYWTGFRSPTRSLITSSAPANGKARGLRSCRSCNSADKLWRLKCERSHSIDRHLQRRPVRSSSMTFAWRTPRCAPSHRAGLQQHDREDDGHQDRPEYAEAVREEKEHLCTFACCLSFSGLPLGPELGEPVERRLVGLDVLPHRLRAFDCLRGTTFLQGKGLRVRGADLSHGSPALLPGTNAYRGD